MFTQPIAPLSALDLSGLRPEMLASRQEGRNHYDNRPEYADWALQQCRSVWLNFEDATDRSYTTTKWFALKTTQAYHGSKKIGRAYYTTLPPGKAIKDHADVEPYFDNVTRYHVYFDLHPRQLFRQRYSTLESNSLHLFRYDRNHAYFNASDEPWTFLVFDVLH